MSQAKPAQPPLQDLGRLVEVASKNEGVSLFSDELEGLFEEGVGRGALCQGRAVRAV